MWRQSCGRPRLRCRETPTHAHTRRSCTHVRHPHTQGIGTDTPGGTHNPCTATHRHSHAGMGMHVRTRRVPSATALLRADPGQDTPSCFLLITAWCLESQGNPSRPLGQQVGMCLLSPGPAVRTGGHSPAHAELSLPGAAPGAPTSARGAAQVAVRWGGPRVECEARGAGRQLEGLRRPTPADTGAAPGGVGVSAEAQGWLGQRAREAEPAYSGRQEWGGCPGGSTVPKSGW